MEFLRSTCCGVISHRWRHVRRIDKRHENVVTSEWGGGWWRVMRCQCPVDEPHSENEIERFVIQVSFFKFSESHLFWLKSEWATGKPVFLTFFLGETRTSGVKIVNI